MEGTAESEEDVTCLPSEYIQKVHVAVNQPPGHASLGWCSGHCDASLGGRNGRAKWRASGIWRNRHAGHAGLGWCNGHRDTDLDGRNGRAEWCAGGI